MLYRIVTNIMKSSEDRQTISIGKYECDFSLVVVAYDSHTLASVFHCDGPDNLPTSQEGFKELLWSQSAPTYCSSGHGGRPLKGRHLAQLWQYSETSRSRAQSTEILAEEQLGSTTSLSPLREVDGGVGCFFG